MGGIGSDSELNAWDGEVEVSSKVISRGYKQNAPVNSFFHHRDGISLFIYNNNNINCEVPFIINLEIIMFYP